MTKKRQLSMIAMVSNGFESEWLYLSFNIFLGSFERVLTNVN
jgi:hypothetical protein